MVSAQQAEEQLAGLYDQLGDAPRALTHFRRFISLRDSIRNADNEKATLQQRLGYEYDLKETSLRAA